MPLLGRTVLMPEIFLVIPEEPPFGVLAQLSGTVLQRHEIVAVRGVWHADQVE